MKLSNFEYACPATLGEAIAILVDNENARPLAGGQSLLPMMALRLAAPEMLVDLGGIEEISSIEHTSSGLRIGAMVTHDENSRSDSVRQSAPLLHEALHHVAHQAVRNRGTIGGSIANADGSAEMPVVAVALSATMIIQGRDGVREVPASEFFQGHYSTAIGEGELLTHICIPTGPKIWAFEELARRPGDFAMAMAAAGLEMSGSQCIDAMIVVGGVSDRPIRAEAASAFLKGKHLDQTVAKEAARLALDGVRVRSDIHANADFRAELARTLVTRALLRAGSAAND